MNKEMAKEKLELALDVLEDYGSETYIPRVLSELQDGFYDEVSIFRTGNFEMIFEREVGEITLKTTFSNQEITHSWIEELSALRDMRSGLEELIKDYLKYNA